MARRKRHHTVTRALLAGFAEHGKVVGRRRGVGSSELSLSISDATVVSDFYTPDARPLDDAVEDWLSTAVENRFSALLPELRSGAQPNASMNEVIARFVAVSVLRTRTARSYMIQIDRAIAGTVLLSRLAPAHGWRLAEMSTSDVDRLRDLYQRAWESLSPRADPVLSQLRTVVRESFRIEERLQSYAWSVLTVAEPSIVIGDAPVVCLGGQECGWRGLVPNGAAVFLPLSPRSVLMGGPAPSVGSPSTGALAEVVNALTVREAYDVVLRHPTTPWPSGLTLSGSSPRLPQPTFTVRPSRPNRAPTFPYTYPQLDDESRTALLEHLGSVDVVE